MANLTTANWFASICFLSLLVCSCQPKDREITESTPFVNPPVKEWNPSFSSFEFDASKAYTFTSQTGSKVHFPKQCFLDSLGNPYQGKVAMKYREFHDAMPVYLAGIPMDYNGNGPFETAGSFELRNVKSNLKINPEKAVQVKLASFKKGNDYDFFYLNEEGEQWDSLGRTKPRTNYSKRKKIQTNESLKPKLAFPLNRNYFACNYNGILDIYLQDKIKNADHTGIQKKLASYGLGWEDLDVRGHVIFEGKKILAGFIVWKNLHKKSFPKWGKDAIAKVYLKEGNRYLMEVKNLKTKTVFTTEVEAVMTLKSLFAFPPEEWKKNYNTTMAKVRKERERLALLADVYRDFSIQNFGIYNWDRLLKMDDKVELLAQFEFGVPLNEKLQEMEVVYISGDRKSLIKFPASQWEKMTLVPDDKGFLFSILPDKKIALYSSKKYRKIDFKDLRKESNPSYDFAMEMKDLGDDPVKQLMEMGN